MTVVVRDPDPRTDDGRTRLLDTAERLFDERGLDAVSLRTITLEAGHRNPSAVNYHFGDRDQLVMAVFERRHVVVEAERAARLAALDERSSADPREVIAAVLLPSAELLRTVGGRRFLRLLLQGTVHPAFYHRTALATSASLASAVARMFPLVEHVAPDRRLGRLRLALGAALYALADQARLLDTDDPPRPVPAHDDFCDDLITMVLGSLRA
ncbi:MAG: helix-turn-helix domain-containing protein [Acidimicrobiales bacterium]